MVLTRSQKGSGSRRSAESAASVSAPAPAPPVAPVPPVASASSAPAPVPPVASASSAPAPAPPVASASSAPEPDIEPTPSPRMSQLPVQARVVKAPPVAFFVSNQPEPVTQASEESTSGTNLLTSNTPTPTTTEGRTTSESSSTARSKKQRSKSKASQKRKRVLKAELELLKIREQIAAAELDQLQADSETEDDSDLDTVIDSPEDPLRVSEWVQDATILAIANEPHTEAAEQLKTPAEVHQRPSGAQPAPHALPAASPATVREMRMPPVNGTTQTLDSAPMDRLHSENSLRVNSNSANNSGNLNSDSANDANSDEKIKNSAPYGNSALFGCSDYGRPTGEVHGGQPRYENLFTHNGQTVPVAPTPAGVVVEKQPRSEMAELASVLAQAIRAGTQSTPRRFTELPAYSGSYQEWLAFKAAYIETATAYSETENVARLRKSLKGKAREAVESLLIYNVESQTIMRALESRFGRPDAIALAELERLRALPRPTDNPRDICVFASRVANIVATLQALQKVYYLYNPEIIKATIEKLSPAMKYRWYDFAAEQQSTSQEPDLLRMARFLDREAARCSPYAQPETEATTAAGAKNRNKTYTVSGEPDKQAAKTCPICNETGHSTVNCKRFISATSQERWDLAKKHRLCFRCLFYRTKNHTCKANKCEQDGCRYLHNKLLHFTRLETTDSLVESITSTNAINSTRTFLKIIPVTASGPDGEVSTYALLDDGSTVTLVDEDVATVIGAQGPLDPLRIEAIANTTVQEVRSRRITFTLRGLETHEVQARTIQGLKLSPQSVTYEDIRESEHLKDIERYLIHTNAKPRILIGQDNWHLLVTNAMRTGGGSQPVASLTPLGWVLHGSRSRSLGQRVNFISYPEKDQKMDEELHRYFAIDSLMITPKRPENDPDTRALKILQEETTQREDGFYETSLLWKNKQIDMPDNRANALKRLISTEKKIDKDAGLKAKYTAQMANLIAKGYAEEAPPPTGNRIWYLPHFAVVNPMKPDKLRVVHDAAAITKGTSLNSRLFTGPDLLQSLPGVLMRFRQHPKAVSADIAEMFMRIKIKNEDRNSLRYLWRGEHRGEIPPTEYRMTSLIFGATSSPATAIFIKNLNATKYENEYPEGAKAIVNNHYMDDYLQSFKTADQAIEIAGQVKFIHSKGNFELRQWTSNDSEVLEKLEPGQTQTSSRQLDDGTKAERTLGLIWRPGTDELAFNLEMAKLPPNILKKGDPTKREMLKVIMSLFDPLGFASPITTRAKQILQETWRRGTGWDDPIPKDLVPQWSEWLEHLENLRHVAVPRCYNSYSDASKVELHTFVDASELAYASVLYWRVVNPDLTVRISLITAKARVAPLKMLSIPRLELQAAVMGSRMAETVSEEHDRPPDQRFFWTDSKTVLTWLKTGARSYKPFVAHRIAAIEENSSLKEWRWVPTKMNVADDATRDVPAHLTRKHRWFQGPDFLKEDPKDWPTELPTATETTGEERTTVTTAKVKPKLSSALPDPERFSKFERLVRTTARVLQFIEKIRLTERVEFKRTQKNRQKDPDWRQKPLGTPRSSPKIAKGDRIDRFQAIDTATLRRAENLLVRASQEDAFSSELDAIQYGREIPNNSRLRSLKIEIRNNLIVLKSRIEAAEGISETVKSPPVLDGNSRLANLFLDSIHRKLHHAGVETTINECRQHYWILRLRPAARMAIHRCLICRIRKASAPQPPTGNHPPARLAHHCRPFSYTGIDYFGPIVVTVGRTTPKRYVALFTCLTTRAIHLELASDLSTGAAVMALRRMMARRGCPTEIWSDNGSNLRGADKELRAAIDRATTDEATARGISWRFIPPGAPFMGGAWERLVRSTKTALAATLHERRPQEEVLLTLLTEAEFTINSRPLTHVSVDPADPEALTPNHFLLLGPARTPHFGPFTDGDLIGRNHWRAAQRLADIFWARWLREYLPELQNRRDPRGSGTSVKLGDVVLIADPNLPRNTWPRGVIVATYPGADNIVRAVDVRTSGGILRRPTKKVIVLPTDESSSTAGVPAAGVTGRREDVPDDRGANSSNSIA